MKTQSNTGFNLFDELDRGLNQWLGDALRGGREVVPRPAVTVIEFPDRYTVECDLPGLRLEDIQLNFHDGMLEISGERHAVEPEEGGEVTTGERPVGRFLRKLRISKDVDVSAIDATLADGVLLIRIPKTEAVQPQKISIRRPSGDS